MRRAALDAFLAEQIADAKAAGRAVLGAPQGHDDEGLRPDHLRPRRGAVLPGRLRRARRRPAPRSAATPTTAWPACSPRSAKLPADRAAAIEAAIAEAYDDGPALAMVDSEPRDHQPARAQRRHHRRLDAGGDPLVGPDVERRRRAAGHQVRHPGLVLRPAVRRDGRLLPRARRLRPDHHGHHAQRRADGAEGRGVRQPRQDLRDRRRRHRAGGRRRRQRRCSRTRSPSRRHLAGLPDQGRPDPQLGASWPCRAPGRPARRRCSGWTRPAATTPRCSRRSAPSSPSSTPTG